MRLADGTHTDLIDVADLAYESHGPDRLYAQFSRSDRLPTIASNG